MPTQQKQTVYTVLRYLMEKGLIKQGWIEEKCHWRLKAIATDVTIVISVANVPLPHSFQDVPKRLYRIDTVC